MNSLMRFNYLFRKSAFGLNKFRYAGFCTNANKGTLVNLKNSNELDKILAGEDPVIVDFYADWCGPCRKLTPIIEGKLKEKKFTLVKINVDNHPDLAEKYDVNGIPYVVFFKKGGKVSDFAGFNEESLNKMINSI